MRTPTIIGVLLAGGLALTGCVPSERPSSAPSEPGTPPAQSAIAPAGAGGPKAPNQVKPGNTDREFAEQLLAHHANAKQLLDLAETSSQEEKVKEFAGQVEEAQSPTVDRATSWLKATEGPEAANDAKEGGVGENIKMPPTDSEAVAALEEAHGAEFEHLFATSIAEHLHEMLDMGHTELEDGTDKQLRDLAQQIVSTRQPLLERAESLQKEL